MIECPRNIIIQILGSIMERPTILNDTDKYQIEPTDFSRQLDRYIYSAIYNLYVNGAEKIHTIDIDQYLKNNNIAADLMKKENGIQMLQDCETHSETNNFNFYYNSFKKFALLRELEKNGRNISQFYCSNPLDPDFSKINEKFEKLKPSDIINTLKGEVAVLEDKYSYNTEVEEVRAGDGILDLLHNLETKPEVGIPLQGEIFNMVTRGARTSKLYLRSASSGVGKAIPNYTKIPTTEGIKRVDEIKVGDYLFDRNGIPTKVLAVYPQSEKKKIFKIYFKSGKIAECCEEHLWGFHCNSSNNELIRSISLKDLFTKIQEKGYQNKQGKYRYSVPMNKPLFLPKRNLPIDPYVMGLILGDGSFRTHPTQKAFFYSSEDEELPMQICQRMGYDKYKKNKGDNHNWVFEKHINGVQHFIVHVQDILADYPELWEKKSIDKFIPQEYLWSSIEQRRDLLAGLLDTDGCIMEDGTVNFITASELLKENFIFLCHSLGYTTSVFLKTSEKSSNKIYSIHVQTPPEEKIKIFKLTRKKDRAQIFLNNKKRKELKKWDSIIKIEETDNYTDMTCFTVDNKEALFLMNDCIVTHNTRTMIGDCCNLAYPIHYDNVKRKWIATGHCEKVCYVATEQDISEIQTMILSWLTGINEECFLYGTFELQDTGRIMKAVKIMEQYINNFYLVRMPDPSASIVKNLFRKYNLQKGISYFFYDYIFSSPAMLNEYRDLLLPEYVCLRLFTTALKNLAVELDSFILTSTQISNDDDKGGFKDHHQIQGARQIVNLVDFACIMSRPTVDELKLVSGLYENINYKPNVIMDVFKNRRGRWTQIRIWGYNDLGTCRRKDLFVTTPDNKPIEDLRVINFETDITPEIEELERYYNDNMVGKEEQEPILEAFEVMVEKSQQSHAEHDEDFYISSAFENKVDNLRRLNNVDIGDLI